MVKLLPTMQETQVLIPGSRFLGEGNGNSLQYSWKIPWMEEPGRLQSMRMQRVGYE